MHDAILANRRRSRWLIATMGALLLSLGGAIGAALDPGVGALFGAGAAVVLWLILWATASIGGDSILLNAGKAIEIEKADAPQLFNVVEEMTIASGLPQMPRVFIIDDPTLNAFAVGRDPRKACVAVTSGLLKRLSRDELQGVIAHEIGHIKNHDVRFLTLAAVMLGAIVMLSRGFLHSLRYGAGRSRRSSDKGGGGAAAIMLLVALALAVLAPIFAQMLYFACSRRREHLADASSALFTRYPEGLASALERISTQIAPKQLASEVLAPLYIVNPLQAQAAMSLFSTHPPTEQRIRILRTMAGAGLADYDAAYRATTGDTRHVIGDLARAHDAAAAPARATTASASPSSPATTPGRVAQAERVGDLLGKALGLPAVACTCGARLRFPANYRRPTARCPRCGRTHAAPGVEHATSAASRDA